MGFYKDSVMNKKIFMVLSALAALNITACSTGSADRYGTALGDISKLKATYTLNSTRIDEVRQILGTPNFSAKTNAGQDIYIYTYKVDYPFEGLSSLELVNLYSHNKNNVLNDEIEFVPTTSKIIALSTDEKGVITDDFIYGYKFIYSKTAKNTNNSYCVTALSEKEMANFVNFSQYEIESVADRDTQASTFSNLVKTGLNKHFGEVSELEEHVKTIKGDSSAVANRPVISKETYCNEITCNKQI